MITTQIQTANFRATLAHLDTYSLKALTPMAKAYFKLKDIRNGVEAIFRTDADLMQHLAYLEDGVAKLAQI